MELTQEQIEQIQIDYGMVYLNYGVAGERQLAPTRGGGTFEVKKNIRDIDFDGKKGKTKGMQVLGECDAMLKIPLLNVGLDDLALAMPYATYTGGKISMKSSNFGLLPSGAYIENVALICKTVGGSYKLIKIYSGMNEADFSLAATPKGEAVINFEIAAHWDAQDDTKDLYSIEDIDAILADSVIPAIASSVPADGAIGVAVSAAPYVTFSEAVRNTDITTDNITLLYVSDGMEDNLVSDPTLTVDANSDGFVDGWTKFADPVDITSTWSIDGGQKNQITANTGSTAKVSFNKTFPAAPGDKYFVSVDMKALSASGTINARLVVSAETSVGVQVGAYLVETNVAPADWSTYQFQITVPSTAAQIKVLMANFPVTSGATGSVWFRNVVVRKQVDVEYTPVAGSVTYNPSTFRATFTPSANLQANSNYVLNVARVRDLAGNMMVPDSINFKTT